MERKRKTKQKLNSQNSSNLAMGKKSKFMSINFNLKNIIFTYLDLFDSAIVALTNQKLKTLMSKLKTLKFNKEILKVFFFLVKIEGRPTSQYVDCLSSSPDFELESSFDFNLVKNVFSSSRYEDIVSGFVYYFKWRNEIDKNYTINILLSLEKNKLIFIADVLSQLNKEEFRYKLKPYKDRNIFSAEHLDIFTKIKYVDYEFNNHELTFLIDNNIQLVFFSNKRKPKWIRHMNSHDPRYLSTFPERFSKFDWDLIDLRTFNPSNLVNLKCLVNFDVDDNPNFRLPNSLETVYLSQTESDADATLLSLKYLAKNCSQIKCLNKILISRRKCLKEIYSLINSFKNLKELGLIIKKNIGFNFNKLNLKNLETLNLTIHKEKFDYSKLLQFKNLRKVSIKFKSNFDLNEERLFQHSELIKLKQFPGNLPYELINHLQKNNLSLNDNTIYSRSFCNLISYLSYIQENKLEEIANRIKNIIIGRYDCDCDGLDEDYSKLAKLIPKNFLNFIKYLRIQILQILPFMNCIKNLHFLEIETIEKSDEKFLHFIKNKGIVRIKIHKDCEKVFLKYLINNKTSFSELKYLEFENQVYTIEKEMEEILLELTKLNIPIVKICVDFDNKKTKFRRQLKELNGLDII